MNAKASLKLLALLAFGSLLALSIWASLSIGVMATIRDLLAAPASGNNPWLLATMADAFFAFLWFWVWVAWRERNWTPRVIWLLLIIALGNLAIATYVLLALHRLPAGASASALFARARE